MYSVSQSVVSIATDKSRVSEGNSILEMYMSC